MSSDEENAIKLLDTAQYQAKKEIHEEVYRELVDELKEDLRQKAAGHRWWHVIFPWKITITRR